MLAFAVDLVTKLLAVSQLTDHPPIRIIPGVLDLQLIRNPGAAFGLAGGATIIFTLVAGAVVVFILATARRLRSRGWAVALGLLLGGAPATSATGCSASRPVARPRRGLDPPRALADLQHRRQRHRRRWPARGAVVMRGKRLDGDVEVVRKPASQR